MSIATACSRMVVGLGIDGIQIVRYASIEDVPVAIWNALASTSAVGLEAHHLRAVEVSDINEIHPYRSLRPPLEQLIRVSQEADSGSSG